MCALARKPLLPEFEGSSFEGFAVNYLKTNFWRVAYVFGDFEDAVSEAKLVFYDCRQRYGGTVNSLAHFMRLYQMMLRCWINDYSRWDTTERQLQDIYPQQVSTVQEGTLMASLNEASSELKTVIQLIINAPAEVLAILKQEGKKGADLCFVKAVELSGYGPEKVPVLQHELEELLT